MEGISLLPVSSVVPLEDTNCVCDNCIVECGAGIEFATEECSSGMLEGKGADEERTASRVENRATGDGDECSTGDDAWEEGVIGIVTLSEYSTVSVACAEDDTAASLTVLVENVASRGWDKVLAEGNAVLCVLPSLSSSPLVVGVGRGHPCRLLRRSTASGGTLGRKKRP